MTRAYANAVHQLEIWKTQEVRLQVGAQVSSLEELYHCQPDDHVEAGTTTAEWKHELGAEPEQHGPEQPEHREQQHAVEPRAVQVAVRVQLRVACDDLHRTAERSPCVLEPPEDHGRRHVPEHQDDHRVGCDGHRLAGLREELHDRDGLRWPDSRHEEERDAEPREEPDFGAREEHHNESRGRGDHHEVEHEVHGESAAHGPGHSVALGHPVEGETAEHRAGGAGDDDDRAEDQRHLGLSLEEALADEQDRTEHAEHRERERVRGVPERDERERDVPEHAPPLGSERGLVAGGLNGGWVLVGDTGVCEWVRGLDLARASCVVVLVVVDAAAQVTVPHVNPLLFQVCRHIIAVFLLCRHLVQLVRDAKHAADHRRDHQRRLHEERPGPHERRRREDGAVDVARRHADRDGRDKHAEPERTVLLRHVGVGERHGVAVERSFAHAAEHAAEEQQVVAVGVVRESVEQDREDPGAHPPGDSISTIAPQFGSVTCGGYDAGVKWVDTGKNPFCIIF